MFDGSFLSVSVSPRGGREQQEAKPHPSTLCFNMFSATYPSSLFINPAFHTHDCSTLDSRPLATVEGVSNNVLFVSSLGVTGSAFHVHRPIKRGYNKNVSRSAFLSGDSRGVFPFSSYLLKASHIRWLAAPFFRLQSQQPHIFDQPSTTQSPQPLSPSSLVHFHRCLWLR